MQLMEANENSERLLAQLVQIVQKWNQRDVQLQLLHVLNELMYLNVQLILQLLELTGLMILQGLQRLLGQILQLLNSPQHIQMKMLRNLREFVELLQQVLNAEQMLESRLLLLRDGHVQLRRRL